MIRIQSLGITAAFAVGMMFVAAAAQAEVLKFSAEMTGAAEVPPTDSKATGTAEVTLDTDAKTVTWVYTDKGLSGDITAAHIHGPASATATAAPVVDTMTKTMEGSAPITDAQATDLKAGMYYFNVHTEKFPAGEIRGQLEMKK